MSEDLKWVIGIAMTITLFFGTALIGAFRNLSNKITARTAALHDRIDDVKEKYVRRDDLDGHIKRLDSRVQEIRDEMRENHRQVIDAITRDK
ncbi:hypothetical protein [Tateyamaria sp. syn59]|uniref:hypothetical protein n=1 Tax=Tateyamaria sp. syn59 TaxID=2576942 RepID=UPI0011BEDAEC|nr:hypothetical protein [Tateyamaria sp. syn59]